MEWPARKLTPMGQIVADALSLPKDTVALLWMHPQGTGFAEGIDKLIMGFSGEDAA